jgi:hypothetical protein
MVSIMSSSSSDSLRAVVIPTASELANQNGECTPNDDDSSVGSIDGDDEAEEIDVAVAKADAEPGNPTLVKLAQEKVNALEKRLVQLNERKGRKISSAVWKNGNLC